MRIAYIYALACFSLAGCAQYAWVNTQKSDEELNKDSYLCQSEAAKLYPPVFKTIIVSAGYDAPSTITCSGSSCTNKPGRSTPPVTREQDMNEQNREDAFAQCMRAQGWQRIRVD